VSCFKLFNVFIILPTFFILKNVVKVVYAYIENCNEKQRTFETTAKV